MTGQVADAAVADEAAVDAVLTAEPDADRGGDQLAGRGRGGHHDRPVPGAGGARLTGAAADD